MILPLDPADSTSQMSEGPDAAAAWHTVMRATLSLAALGRSIHTHPDLEPVDLVAIAVDIASSLSPLSTCRRRVYVVS